MSTLTFQEHIDLTSLNTFGLAAKARYWVEVGSDQSVRALLDHAQLGKLPKFVLGGGSNIVLGKDIDAVVIHVRSNGVRLIDETPQAFIVEADAGKNWHDFVRWTLDNGYPGLENLALIPGSVGAAPVQNIGAYGVELSAFFDSLDLVDLFTGRSVMLDKQQCHFGYRDSIFKQDLAGKSVILRVRLRLPKIWRANNSYADLKREFKRLGMSQPTARQIFDMVCAIRAQKLPDARYMGNVGSFFKNPIVSATIANEILDEFPHIVSYPLPNGLYKLAAAWMIEACGWKGRAIGQAAVSDKHALVLINRGGATGADVIALAKAIQVSVAQKFGIQLETEPLLLN